MSQPCNVPEGYVQGDPNRNFLFQIAVSLKRSIFDPSLVKPKCVLGVADFFQFSAVCLQFPKKSATLQTHFGLYNMGSNIHSFWAMAIWNKKFRFGSPCNTLGLESVHTPTNFIQKRGSFTVIRIICSYTQILWNHCRDGTLVNFVSLHIG